jgi:uncharacterized protein (DUF2236 family)
MFTSDVRLKMDIIADDSIKRIIESGSLLELNSFFESLSSNNETVFPNEKFEAYFNATKGLPNWANKESLEAGEKFFSQYGIQIVLVLLCKALPETYACAKGAEVLYRTGRLIETEKGSITELTYRIVQTAQFILNVMAGNGFSENGKAISTTQKIRLIHASIRYYVAKSGWSVDKFGQPINQEDLAGTMLAFSYQTLEGLKFLGIDISDEEYRGYMHCWEVVGHILGIEDSYIAKSNAEAKQYWEEITSAQYGRSDAGIELVDSLIDFLQSVVKYKCLKGLPVYMMIHLVDEGVADYLDLHVKHKNRYRILFSIVKFISVIYDKIVYDSAFVRKISQKLGFHILQHLVIDWANDEKIRFEVPPSLRKNWNIN